MSTSIWDSLTELQKKLVNLVKIGKANKEIANELGLVESTIKNHISVIMKKLKASNRAHIVYIILNEELENLKYRNIITRRI